MASLIFALIHKGTRSKYGWTGVLLMDTSKFIICILARCLVGISQISHYDHFALSRVDRRGNKRLLPKTNGSRLILVPVTRITSQGNQNCGPNRGISVDRCRNDQIDTASLPGHLINQWTTDLGCVAKPVITGKSIVHWP